MMTCSIGKGRIALPVFAAVGIAAHTASAGLLTYRDFTGPAPAEVIAIAPDRGSPVKEQIDCVAAFDSNNLPFLRAARFIGPHPPAARYGRLDFIQREDSSFCVPDACSGTRHGPSTLGGCAGDRSIPGHEPASVPEGASVGLMGGSLYVLMLVRRFLGS